MEDLGKFSIEPATSSEIKTLLTQGKEIRDGWILDGRFWVRISDGKRMFVIQGGGPANTVQNDKYAFGDDDGSESGHTLDTENTDRTSQTADVTFLIRIQIEETAGGTESDGYALYMQKNGTGGFNAVPASDTNSGVRLADDTQSRADDENTTERLSYSGSSSFATGRYDDGTVAVGTGSFSLDQDTNGYTDLEFAIQIDSDNASDGDDFEFRVHFDGGGALDGYPASYPTATASIAVSDHTVNETDGLTIGETLSQEMADMAVDESDGLTVGDTLVDVMLAEPDLSVAVVMDDLSYWVQGVKVVG